LRSPCYTSGMEVRLDDLEREMFGAPQVDLVRGALVASGVKDRRDLEGYLARLDELCQHIDVGAPEDESRETAKAVFDWLWKVKPKRYEYQGSFRLTEVLDAQLDPRAEEVGNCLGLTVLYNVLATRFELPMKAVYLDEAFGRQSHVFSVLEVGDVVVDIDNIFPHGFDFKEHLRDPQRVVWEDAELISDIYHSIGWGLHEQRDLERAIVNYSKAIYLNPGYGKAFLNRGIAYAMMGMEEEAKRDFNLCGEDGCALRARLEGG
jgi:tetratricopeptide (TPR) repeat protein